MPSQMKEGEVAMQETGMPGAERFIEHFQPGAVIFAEGSQGDAMYVVLSGAVDIVRGNSHSPQHLARLRAGEMFGEMALVGSGLRAATAVAADENTRLVRIDQARFVYLVSQQPAFALSVMRTMAGRNLSTPSPAPLEAA